MLDLDAIVLKCTRCQAPITARDWGDCTLVPSRHFWYNPSLRLVYICEKCGVGGATVYYELEETMSDEEPIVPEAPPSEEGWTLVHEAQKLGKNSCRITHYSIKKLGEDERPTSTVQMKIHSQWTRRDRQASPEEPEYYDIPSYKLAHLIQEHGTKQ